MSSCIPEGPAAGTGRFLELMARTLELNLDEMARVGLHWEQELTISSMCTVFAESEIVSLLAKAPTRGISRWASSIRSAAGPPSSPKSST